jgi:TolA-binding protein
MTLEATDITKNQALVMLLSYQAFNAKMFDLAAINFDAAFKYADKLSRVGSAQEFAGAAVDQIRDQFEAMSEEAEELSATIQGTLSKDDAAMESGFGD